MNKVKQQFPRIDSQSWEHPADRAALFGLRSVDGFDELFAKILGGMNDKSLELHFLASAVRIDAAQLPKIHQKLQETCEILDVPVPPLYLSNQPVANAGALGFKKPCILLTSALLEQLDDEGLGFVLGHEMGHIMSGHILGRTLVFLLSNLGDLLFAEIVPSFVKLVFMYALLEWFRKSEYSADRAGLLVSQDLEVAAKVMLSLAGGKRAGELSLEAFYAQAKAYQDNNSLDDDARKLFNLLGQSHPFPALRLGELKAWHDGGSYQEILHGAYRRRDSDEKAQRTVFDEFGDAGKAYSDEFKRNSPNFHESMEKFRQGAESAAKEMSNLFGKIFSPPSDKK